MNLTNDLADLGTWVQRDDKGRAGGSMDGAAQGARCCSAAEMEEGLLEPSLQPEPDVLLEASLHECTGINELLDADDLCVVGDRERREPTFTL